MIYDKLFRVVSGNGRYGWNDFVGNSLEEAELEAILRMKLCDSMTTGFWKKTPMVGAYVVIIEEPHSTRIRCYNQIESGKWTSNTDPYKIRSTWWPRV